jgi:hypothetical protein
LLDYDIWARRWRALNYREEGKTVDLMEVVFHAYLSRDSKKEVSFIGDLLNMPLPESDADGENWYRDASERAERDGDLPGFNNFYAALKGLFLFWMDYKAFDIMKGTETPNLYRDRLFARMDMYRAMRAEKAEILRAIEQRYADYAERYAKYAESGGDLDGGVNFETDAFFGVLKVAREDLSAEDEASRTERAKEYFGECKSAIFGWLGKLRGKPETGVRLA